MFSKKKNISFLPAFSIVEILVSIGVFSIIVFSILELFLVSRHTGFTGKNKVLALHLIDDYFEKIKNIRRNNWEALKNGRYIIEEKNKSLTLTPTSANEINGRFQRYLLIENALRDKNGKLVSTGGTNDPSSKKITVFVSWNSFPPGFISQSIYLTRYYDNLAQIWDTDEEFNQGTNQGTAVVKNDDGEVILGAGGRSDWCRPELTIAALDLNRHGVAIAVAADEGIAYTGTANNASGKSFIRIDISNDKPPVASIPEDATFDGYKTNDVYGEILGNKKYAYLATDTNDKEVVIIDITNPPYSESGYFNAPGVNDGANIRISGNTGFLTQANYLRSFYLGDRKGSRPASGSATLAGYGGKFTIVGKYAFITLLTGTYELEILDISDPTNMVRKALIDVDKGLPPLNQKGRDIVVNQTLTRAYLAVSTDYSNRPEFLIYDITNINNPQKIGSGYSTGEMNPRGLEIVTGGRAIIVGSGGEEYQVVKINTQEEEANPTQCGGLNIDAGINDSASVIESDGDAYTYIVTNDFRAEFKIIEGGPGGNLSNSGVYESQTIQMNHNTAFNRFFATFEKPLNTQIRFQIAVKDAILDNCENVSFGNLDFVGPDGTPSTYFTEGEAIPYDDDDLNFENPGRCFRFRSYLETADLSQTPILYDFIVNYSP